MTELVNKTCVRCFEDKPLAEFPKYSRHLDGLSDLCRACHKILRDVRKTAAPVAVAVVGAGGVTPVTAVLAQVAKTQAIIDAEDEATAKKAHLAAQARARRAAKKAAR